MEVEQKLKSSKSNPNEQSKESRQIQNKGSLSEHEAYEIFLQIIQALNYGHSNGTCHKYLKPENLLFLIMADNFPIKVIDFGLNTLFEDSITLLLLKRISQKVTMKTKVRTPYYISPEVFKRNCDELQILILKFLVLFKKEIIQQKYQSCKFLVFQLKVLQHMIISSGIQIQEQGIIKIIYIIFQNISGILSSFTQMDERIQQANKIKRLKKLDQLLLNLNQMNRKLQIYANYLNYWIKMVRESRLLQNQGRVQLEQVIHNKSDQQIQLNVWLLMETEQSTILNQAFEMLDSRWKWQNKQKGTLTVLGQSEKIVDEKYWDELIREADKNGD
ncbi:unnamed protein product [Paramecium sonneborni]|uniref:Protein kinase domain-containing protein n=1 Tax=Paramecium sonneborni TaxID=65129 RepID=A0A8S1KE84_9CILI|nr:unnamed protein product [Paramecium sonneborni]